MIINLDEFLKSEEQKLEQDCITVLGILKMNEGFVKIQNAGWRWTVEDGSEKRTVDLHVCGYFGLDQLRLRKCLLTLHKRGILRYGAVKNLSETDLGTTCYGRHYFWVRLTPCYKRALECEVTV